MQRWRGGEAIRRLEQSISASPKYHQSACLHMSSPPISSRIASALVTLCTTHISDTTKLSSHDDEKDKDDYRRELHHEFARFRLWSRGFYEAPPGTANLLDAVLDEAMYLKEPTIMLLASFASCLLADPLRKLGSVNTRRILASALSEATRAYPHFEETLARELDTWDTVMEDLRECVDSLFDVLSTLDDVLEEMKEYVAPVVHLVEPLLTMGGDPMDPDYDAAPENPVSRGLPQIPEVPEVEYAATAGGDGSISGASLTLTGDATSTTKVLGVGSSRLVGEDPAPAGSSLATGDEIGISDMMAVGNPPLEVENCAPVGGMCGVVEMVGKSGVAEKEGSLIVGEEGLGEGDPLHIDINHPGAVDSNTSRQDEEGDISMLVGEDLAVGEWEEIADTAGIETLLDREYFVGVGDAEMMDDQLGKLNLEEPPALPKPTTGTHWEIYQRHIRDRFPHAVGQLDIERLAKGNVDCYDRLVRLQEEQARFVPTPVLVIDLDN